jgi:hypothetical protein
MSARLCVGKNFRQIYDLLSTDIELCLRELSGYDKSRFAQQNAEYMASQGFDEPSGDGGGGDDSDTEIPHG